MAAAVTQLQIITQFHVSENPGSQPAGVGLTSEFVEMDQLENLTPASTPAAALFAIYKTTIASSGYTIDTTAAQGTNGNINANGKKLNHLVVKNPSASAGDVTIKTSVGANPYTIPTQVVKPGGYAVVSIPGLTAIDGTHKTIDVTGTDGDVPEIGMVFG